MYRKTLTFDYFIIIWFSFTKTRTQKEIKYSNIRSMTDPSPFKGRISKIDINLKVMRKLLSISKDISIG